MRERTSLNHMHEYTTYFSVHVHAYFPVHIKQRVSCVCSKRVRHTRMLMYAVFSASVHEMPLARASST